jgi:hypothetical protein
MSPTQGPDTDPLQRLLERVERDREERCREILEAARAEAATMRAEAHAQARARVHRAITAERRRVRERLDAARAEQETRQRQRRHQRINAALERGWGLLEAALVRRWADAEGRRLWLQGALEQAARFLPPGTWTVAHPPDLDPAELPAEPGDLPGLGSPQAGLVSQPDGTLSAGVRLSCGGVEVDATPAGLLADPERIRARLLAALQQQLGEG